MNRNKTLHCLLVPCMQASVDSKSDCQMSLVYGFGTMPDGLEELNERLKTLWSALGLFDRVESTGARRCNCGFLKKKSFSDPTTRFTCGFVAKMPQVNPPNCGDSTALSRLPSYRSSPRDTKS